MTVNPPLRLLLIVDLIDSFMFLSLPSTKGKKSLQCFCFITRSSWILPDEVPVPALKEQIASVTITGVLSEQQRLICRGKFLKDDQLISAYHVEDGECFVLDI
ncbi:unnamed protein product [Lactuca saligna]|uniref:Ubiquitin-like domain-containing protein n=1 Tax=Lactuca saligna TaxID=75948 RepID=A0AA35YT35_LACSI|nr:unnamed protein product [Lactuca saligna]